MDQSKKPALPLVVEWRTWLLDSERLTWRGTYVGLALSRWMGRDGTRAWPSQETLAAAMKVSRSTVRRGLQELVDGGWLVPELRPGRTTNYHAARPGMVPEEVLPSESASPPAEGYVPETPKVVKDQEEPNWFKDPGLIDRVLEERQGLKQWLLRGEGFQLAENPAVFREVFREKFPDLPEELIEEFRVRAVNQGRVPSGNARSVTSTDGGLREPATPSALAYTAEMNDEEVKAMLRELYPGGGAAILLLSPQQGAGATRRHPCQTGRAGMNDHPHLTHPARHEDAASGHLDPSRTQTQDTPSRAPAREALRHLQVREVAELLACSPRTVLRMISAGDLPAVRLPGGSLRVAEVDLVQLLSARRTSSHTGPVEQAVSGR